MKNTLKLLLLTMTLASGTSFAAIKLADTTQSANIQGDASNSASGKGAKATQNVSSNSGDIEIKGKNVQSTNAGSVSNSASGKGAVASQNVSSNAGKVKISGANSQATNVGGAVRNSAKGEGAVASQNIASNSGM